MRSRSRPSMPRPCRVGTLLQELLARGGMEEKLREYRAWEVWDAVVGPQIAAHARPAKIRNQTLEVRVDQPVWMQQLQLMKPKILARLNEELGEEAIADIYWRRGRVEPPAKKGSSGGDLAWRSAPLEQAESSAIEEALSPIADADLRQELRSLFSRQLRYAKKPK